MNRTVKRGVFSLLIVQCALVALGTLLFGVFQDLKAGYSALAGGLSVLLPNAVFAFYVFRYEGAQAAQKIAASLYKGEVMKWILMMIIMTVVFLEIPVLGLPFFVALISVQGVFWLGPWMFK